MAKRYWLMKSEPDAYSIDDLARDGATWWEGVRNYQARNFMTTDMSVGDEVLFYHSSCEPPGVAGLAKIVAAAQPDKTQFEKKSDFHDPKATKDKPIWFCAQVGAAAKFKTFVALEVLRATKSLADMQVLKKGQRLSIQPVTPAEFELIKKMGSAKQ